MKSAAPAILPICEEKIGRPYQRDLSAVRYDKIDRAAGHFIYAKIYDVPDEIILYVRDRGGDP